MKKKVIRIELSNNELDAFLGKLARERYLAENPHGYKKKSTKTKNKKKYTRKGKGSKTLSFFFV